MDDLLLLVVELKKGVESLRSIMEVEKEKDWWDKALVSLRLERPPPTNQDQESPLTSSQLTEDSRSREAGGWKPVHTQGSRQNIPWLFPLTPIPVPPNVPLYNRYAALEVEGQTMANVNEGPSAPSTSQVLTQSERPTGCITTASTREEKRVIVAPF